MGQIGTKLGQNWDNFPNQSQKLAVLLHRLSKREAVHCFRRESFGFSLCTRERPFVKIKAKHKTFKTMSKKINYDVLDQFFAAQLSQNESEATLKALRPQVEQAVQALIEERGLPRDFTGVIDYHGFKIRVQRPTSYTWEQNTQIKDANLDFYKQLHGYYRKLQADVKEARADLKRTAEKLAKAYPNSESIKHGFTIAIVFGKEVDK